MDVTPGLGYIIKESTLCRLEVGTPVSGLNLAERGPLEVNFANNLREPESGSFPSRALSLG